MAEYIIGGKAIAEELGVSVRTVKRYCQCSAFPAGKQGGLTVVERAALDAWRAGLPACGANGVQGAR